MVGVITVNVMNFQRYFAGNRVTQLPSTLRTPLAITLNQISTDILGNYIPCFAARYLFVLPFVNVHSIFVLLLTLVGAKYGTD